MVAKKRVVKKAVSVGGTQVKGFMEFIRSQGVMGLAIGLVLGGAVTTLVKSLIDNLIMPPVGLLLGSADGLRGLKLTLGSTPEGQPAIWSYGVFLNDVINFLVIALVVFFIIRLFDIQTAKK